MKTQEQAAKMRALKGRCWCSRAWRSTAPRNHQDRCVARYNREMRALGSSPADNRKS